MDACLWPPCSSQINGTCQPFAVSGLLFPMGQLQRVLLVEDNETDEALAVRSIRRSGLNISVDVARDGEEACDFLSGGPYQLVLLDIKLPKLSGLEILDRMRRSSATRYVPVIMLTS